MHKAYANLGYGITDNLCDEHDPVPEEPGTTIEMGFKCLVDEGVCLESTWEYKPNPIEGNEGQGPPPEAARKEAGKYKLKNMLDLDENSIEELKSCLKGSTKLPGRPVAFSVPVYSSWSRSMAVQLSGQITMPLPGEDPTGGHAMVIVGYQDEVSVPGGGFFIIRNSYISKYCWEAFTSSAEPCFMATAAYGSPYAPEVQFLREFRDNKLKSTDGGREFVKFYENIYNSFSPTIAEKMNRNSSIKNITFANVQSFK